MDYIMKLFYLYLSRMHVQSDFTMPCKSKSALAIASATKKIEEEKVGAGAIDSALQPSESSDDDEAPAALSD